MRKIPSFPFRKLPLMLILLIGALSASAITFGDYLAPLGVAREGSFFALFNSPPAPATAAAEATVATDRTDYPPGATVYISGSGWYPNETVQLEVDHVGPTGSSFAILTESAHTGHDPWTVTADGTGNIAAEWIVDEDALGETLRLTADGLSSGFHAETTFTDAIGFNKGVYNKDTFPQDSTGKWTTGNAGSNYEEGQWVSYQYQVAGIEGTTPSFDIKFNHYQQNVNAIFIDAFANFRACVDCTEDSDVTQGGNDGIGVGMLLHNVQYPSATSTDKWKLAAPAISFFNGTLNSSGVCVATEDPVNAPSQEHCFHVDGTALQDLFPEVTFSSGVHTITLFYEAHLSNTRTWRNGFEYLIGCPTSQHYARPRAAMPDTTLYGTEAYSGGDPCLLDDSGDWTNTFQGVGFATGSSRHFNIINQTAGSSGALSLPIPTVEAPSGSITIVKVTEPSPAVGTFGFTGDLGAFNLDTDPNTGTSHTITFNDIPPNIPFSVTESSMPNDWALRLIVCTVTSGGTQVTSVMNATATVTLPSTDGASATCTFTNRNENLLNGRIIVIKQTTPDGDPQVFDFSASWDSGTDPDFSLSDGQQHDSCAGGPNCLPAGSYSVAETLPLDWVLTTATCSDGSAVNAISLSEGETVTCTFFNTKQTASLTVTKTPSVTDVCIGSDSPVTYTYVVTNTGTAALTVNLSDDQLGDIDGGAGFSLAAGASQTFTQTATINATTTNVVTASGVTAGGQNATATASATVNARTCTISLTKTPSVTDVCAGSSSPVTYTYVVTNTGDFFSVSGSVTDDQLGSIGSYGPLAPGASATLTKAATINGNTTNIGTATGTFTDADSTTASATATATVNARTCTISLTKTPDVPRICEGSTTAVTYTYMVTNTGNFFSVSGTITDDQLGAVGSYGPLAPGASATLTKVGNLSTTTTNVGTANGTFSDADSTTATATASATVTAFNCSISITKTPDQTRVCNGTSVDYTITVTNNSPEFAWTGSVIDDVIGTLAGSVTIPAGGSQTYTPSHAVTGTVTNTVTASGNFSDSDSTSASATASATVVGYVCTISITKTPSANAVCEGAPVTYTYVVTNNSGAGGFTWSGSLTDDQLGSIDPAITLAPGASATRTASANITGTVVNIGTASGAFDDGSTTSASAQATATVVGQLCRITVVKQTIPDGDPETFTFSGDLSGTIGDGGSITRDVLVPMSYSTTESVPAGWDLTDVTCVGDDNPDTDDSAIAYFDLDLGESITCTFTNTKRGTVSISKTFEGGPIPAGESFDFQLRQGASTSSQGTTLDSVTVDSTTVFPLQLNGSLVPGDYQVCEYIQAGWDSSIRTMLGAFVPESLSDPINVDNSYVCVPVTIDPGENETVAIDNTPPPGGMAKTIGFWRNHSSCKRSNGNQDPVLDDTLATFPIAMGQSRPGFYVGLLYVDTCEEAYLLLTKNVVTGSSGKGKNGTNAASDPAINMSAQLVAAMLNLAAGADAPSCLSAIIAEAQAALVAVSFNGGIPNYGNGPTGAARKARMNYLAGLLDDYNNNELNCNDYVAP